MLAATSNPEAAAIQRAVLQQSSRAGATVAAAIMLGRLRAGTAAEPDAASRPIGSIGVVLGATVDLRASGIDIDVGAARGRCCRCSRRASGTRARELSDLRGTFGSLSAGVIVSESRSILSGGPDGIADAIARRVDEIGAIGV